MLCETHERPTDPNYGRMDGVYLGVRTYELFLCFVSVVRVRVYYVDFFVFFVFRHRWVSQVFTPRQSQRMHLASGELCAIGKNLRQVINYSATFIE